MKLIESKKISKNTIIEPVSEILKSLSTIKISDGRNLFSFRNNKVTNSLKNFEKHARFRLLFFIHLFLPVLA